MSLRNGTLLVLAVTALACSRAMFAVFDDPEGPNLLVVVVMAAVITVISLAAYLSNFFPSLTGFKRSAAAVFIQMFVATGFTVLLR
ncbi:MAG TPA: hypothetical protein VIM56_13830 [Rhizomicrobium sp.]